MAGKRQPGDRPQACLGNGTHCKPTGHAVLDFHRADMSEAFEMKKAVSTENAGGQGNQAETLMTIIGPLAGKLDERKERAARETEGGSFRIAGPVPPVCDSTENVDRDSGGANKKHRAAYEARYSCSRIT